MGRKSEAAKRSWKQWKPEQAREELEAWRSSGLTLATYAERRGVTVELPVGVERVQEAGRGRQRHVRHLGQGRRVAGWAPPRCGEELLGQVRREEHSASTG